MQGRGPADVREEEGRRGGSGGGQGIRESGGRKGGYGVRDKNCGVWRRKGRREEGGER